MSKKFEILCVTMFQNDFSKIKLMNIHSNVIFTNQADENSFKEIEFENSSAKMITTTTRGVGINRNIGLIHATAEICLFGDDDVVYKDNVEEIVVKEFEEHPDADVFIFNLESTGNRKLKKYKKTQKCSRFFKKMGGGAQIAFRLSSVKKANLWFTTLFGGGCVFPCGEDGKWLNDAYNRNLNVYVSKEFLGSVSFECSTWFQGVNERYFYGFGAFYKDAFPRLYPLMLFYLIFRTRKKTNMAFFKKLHWMINGVKGYKKLISYENYVKFESKHL